MGPLRVFRYEPAVILYALGVGVDLLSGFGLVSVSADTRAAIMTVATGLLTITTMFFVHEWSVPAIVSAVTTGLTACAAFGLHLSDHQLGLVASVLTLVLGLILRQAITPTAAAVPARPRM